MAGYLYDGRSWSANTQWVHPFLRRVTICVNDGVSDEGRPFLAPLAADLAGTGPEPEGLPGRVLNVRLAVWAAIRVATLRRSRDEAGSALAVEAAAQWADCPCDGHAVAAQAAAAAATTTAPVWAAYAASYTASAAHAPPTTASAYAGSAAAAAARAVTATSAPADRDEALRSFLRDAIRGFQRLTEHRPEPAADRMAEVCVLIGATS